MNNILLIILLTFVPFLELRASIPYGILELGESWMLVFFLALISNMVLGLILFEILHSIIKIIRKIPFLDSLYIRYVNRTQKKIKKGVEKYGNWAIAVFIGIPLPMSGVYSGALAAYLIGLDRKKFFIATIVGVSIAAILVTIITLTGKEAASLFLKEI